MGVSAQILVYTAWLVAAIAAVGAVYHTLARRDLRRDRAALSELGIEVARHVSPWLRRIRERFSPMTPEERADYQVRKATGVRVTLFLLIPLLILANYWGGKEWGAVLVVCTLFLLPTGTLPFSVAHTHLLRLIGARGPIVSTATGMLLGAVVGALIPWNDGIMKPAAIYGGVYGLLIGLGNTSIFAPRLVADDRPRTLEEQARADGL
jgi:hypothetical protein